MRTILSIILLLVFSTLAQGQLPETPPGLVTSRLVRIQPMELTSYLNSDASFSSVASDKLFYPEISDVLEVDRNLFGILTVFSKVKHPDRPHYKQCIDVVADSVILYGGQFFGFTNGKGERVIVSTYQFVPTPTEFQSSTEIAWPGDLKS